MPEAVIPPELEAVEIAPEIAAEMAGETPMRVVRSKRFEMKPMSVDDAADRIELLSHDFYVFRNADDGDQIAVIYRRRDGDLGLIAAG